MQTRSDKATNPTIIRMAAAMRSIAAERGHCLDLDLIDAGFTADDIHAHAIAARSRAAQAEMGKVA